MKKTVNSQFHFHNMIVRKDKKLRTHITNIYGQSPASTAMIAQNMVTEVAKSLGFNEIGIYSYPIHTDTPQEIRKRVDGMLAGVSAHDVVIVQLPSWNGIEFDELLINKLLSYPDIKIAVFIHDVVPLMFENNYYLMQRSINLYNKAVTLIVPSKAMAKRLKSEGLVMDHIVIQQLWDHVTSLMPETPKFEPLINFAGSVTRFPFVKSWHNDTKLQVFSQSDEKNSNERVSYRGWLPDNEILRHLNRGFGLVWSENTKNQSEREYSKINLSYKLSTYLASGLPVIVNQGISNQKFIEDNNIGIVMPSLSEVDQRIKNITKAQYNDMAENAKRIGYLIRQGYFTKKILIDTMHQILAH